MREIVVQISLPRLWKLMLLAPILGLATAWMAGEWRRRLADDSGRFYTFEESAAYQSFQEQAALLDARGAERKAADGVDLSRDWAAVAAEARRRAVAAGRSRENYEWRARLKQAVW